MRGCEFTSVLAAALLVVACGGGDGATGTGAAGGAAASIARVSGDGQRIGVGLQLLAPFVVKVSNDRGGAVSGAIVTWAVTAGDGTLSRASVATNASGEAAVLLTAGPSEGDISVTAAVDGLSGSPVTFTARALTPAAIAAAAGDGQAARLSQPLAQPLEVKVSAADGGSVPGVAVMWAVTAGGGTLSATSSAADASGIASVDLTLGAAAGGNTVTATLAGASGSPVTFAATATAPVTVTVNMQNIAFNAPGGGDDVTIMLGDTVRWVNLDAVQHTATSNSVPAGGSGFASGLLSQGQSFTFVPNTRGTWVYFCEVHPAIMLNARIAVQ